MIEYRFAERKLAAGDEGKLSGRAASYNKVTTIGGDKWGFREQIAPGAFKKSLKDRDIVLLDQHDTSKPLARTSSGTLEIRDGKEGIDFDAVPSDTTYGRDSLATAKAGNYGGCSFGFEVVKDSWKRGQNGAPDERTLEEVILHEISTVTFPAYGDTKVSARDNMAAALESRERALGKLEDEDRGGDAPGNGKKPYGNVTYADPKNGKYPVDTAAHAKAAWAYINKPANAAKYPLNGVSLSSVKAKIKAACKKFGITVSESNALDLDMAELRSLCSYIAMTDLTDEERDMYLPIFREADEDVDPYDDAEFYERDAKDGDPQNNGSNNSTGKSDAKPGDKGKQPNNCADCKGSGKDKSGNQCATCGGSGHKNGDGKNNESGKGDEDADKNKGNGEKKSETSASETRDDESRSDVDRANRMFALRAKQRREREAAQAAPESNSN